MNLRPAVRLLSSWVSLGLGFGTLIPTAARAEDRWRLDLEGAAAWQTRNQFRIPGTTGTLVSLEDYANRPYPAFRATLV